MRLRTEVTLTGDGIDQYGSLQLQETAEFPDVAFDEIANILGAYHNLTAALRYRITSGQQQPEHHSTC